MKYAVGTILAYPLTGTKPGWLYDHAIVSGITDQLGGLYLLDSCGPNGELSPVSLTTGIKTAWVDDPTNGYAKVER